VGYELEEIGRPKLEDLIKECLGRVGTSGLSRSGKETGLKSDARVGGMKKAARKSARVRGKR
jgi:hypothetical protein